MPSEPELDPVPPCLLPVHNPSLEPEALHRVPGGAWDGSACPAHRAGCSTTSAKVEHYGHPSAAHVARFVCPKGHIREARQVWLRAPMPAQGKARVGRAPLCTRSKKSSMSC